MRRDADEAEELDDEEEEATGAASGPGRFAAGMAIGALIGATVALLFAPAPGRTTRKKLRRRLEDARELAEDGIDELSRRAKKEIKKHVG